ncbi:MAG: glycosyltransferase [Candidatus Daviesbacteria bacterium]|nr:glycosyltransferase [Candidatus Daviesbacteria bacterium]
MRVAIVHDDLVQWGGAERVLLGLSEIYPDAPIYTSVFDRTNTALLRNFGTKKVYTSFLQTIPGWKSLYKALLPFYPIAFEQFDFSRFDLVISHTTRFAKSIITKPQTLHICYMHTPPRFLWHFSGETNFGLGEILLTKLRLYDQVSAHRVDYFLAGSENAKKRIKKVYNIESRVVYPFVDLERFKDIESFDGGYFVIISRGNKYKRVDLAIKACFDLRLPLKVIGGFRESGNFKRVEFLGSLDDETAVSVLAGCRALIIPGVEDFGLTSLEAQTLGKPVIAFKEGGALETVIPGKTGIFFDEQTEESLGDALLRLNSLGIDPQDCMKNAVRFSKEVFIKNFKAQVASL